jgi:hypothetical protein
MKDKVYCEECKYYKDDPSVNPMGYCNALGNRGTWLRRDAIRDDPDWLNRENDCTWHEPNKLGKYLS